MGKDDLVYYMWIGPGIIIAVIVILSLASPVNECEKLSKSLDRNINYFPSVNLCGKDGWTPKWVGGTIVSISEPVYGPSYNRYEYTLTIKGINKQRTLSLHSDSGKILYKVGDFYKFDLVEGFCKTFFSMASSGLFTGELVPMSCEPKL